MTKITIYELDRKKVIKELLKSLVKNQTVCYNKSKQSLFKEMNDFKNMSNKQLIQIYKEEFNNKELPYKQVWKEEDGKIYI